MGALLGRKVGMTQLFSADGELVPVTVLEAGPCVVTQVKTAETDGYEAVQIGFREIDKQKLSKPAAGHLGRVKGKPRKHLAEIESSGNDKFELGQELKVEVFAEGEKTDVTGVSRGKGFQGVVRRWGFSGGPKSHGSHFGRIPGSLGASATPSRVMKGTKLPGQMGGQQVTVKNLEVFRVEKDKNLLFVRGAVPGSRGGLVMIKSSSRQK
ncbi:MAG: 50S ribosomal protein L3 [Terriglobia bacterium]